MARSRPLQLCAVALWAMCLVGVGTGQAERADRPAGEAEPLAAASIVLPAADHAVLPARVVDELRAATQLVPLRTLLVVGMLAAIAALPAAPWRALLREGGCRRALLVRRHAIRLRAPPHLRFA